MFFNVFNAFHSLHLFPGVCTNTNKITKSSNYSMKTLFDQVLYLFVPDINVKLYLMYNSITEKFYSYTRSLNQTFCAFFVVQ